MGIERSKPRVGCLLRRRQFDTPHTDFLLALLAIPAGVAQAPPSDAQLTQTMLAGIRQLAQSNELHRIFAELTETVG